MNNYSWYRGWHDKYSDKGLTVVGVHTPETDDEAKLDALRAKVKEHAMPYAIAADNNRKTWDAWTNTLWPSVYLIDKQGYVRFWWYGELNWNGADGDKIMREKIEELLGE
jgi:peroxiredoxin